MRERLFGILNQREAVWCNQSKQPQRLLGVINPNSLSLTSTKVLAFVVYASSYYDMCPHTATYVFSYGYICVLILQVVEQIDIEGHIKALSI
jgi:hypothetical protein